MMTESTDAVTTSGARRGVWLPLLWRGAVLWLVPFIGTSPLVARDGTLLVSFALFKTVAVGLLVLVVLALRRWPPRDVRPASAATAYVALSVVLDLVLIVGVLGTSAVVWATTVLPAYPLVPFGLLVRCRVLERLR